MATNIYALQLEQVVILDSVCSGQMYVKRNKHLVLYLVSFDLGQNEERFLFLFPKLAGIGGGTCCCRGPMTDAVAAWTDNGISVLRGFALVLIAGFTSSEHKSLRKSSLVSAVFVNFFL